MDLEQVIVFLLCLAYISALGDRRIAPLAHANQLKDDGKTLFELDQPVELTVKQHIRWDDGGASKEFQIREQYSSRQGRAKFTKSIFGELYYDTRYSSEVDEPSKPSFLFKWNQVGSQCTQLPYANFFSYFIPDFEGSNFAKLLARDIAGQKERLRHVIGLAKLVLLVQLNWDRVQRLPDDSTGCIRTLELDDNTKLRIEYCVLGIVRPDANQINGRLEVPESIIYDNERESILVNFEQWKNLDWDQKERDVAETNACSWDTFVIHPGSDCSQFIEVKEDFELRPGSRWAEGQLSFRAITYSKQSPESSQRVTLDMVRSLMRIEDDTPTRRTVSLLDFRNNRQVIGLRRNETDEQLNGRPECYSGPLFSSQLHEDYTSLAKLILGARYFAYMGEGTVQNTRVRMYEAQSKSMPIWMDRSSLVGLEDGSFVRRSSSEMVTFKQPHLNIVLFVEQETNKILLIEVVDVLSTYYNFYHGIISGWSRGKLTSDLYSDSRSADLFSLPQCFENGEADNQTPEVQLLLKCLDARSEKNWRPFEDAQTRDRCFAIMMQQQLQDPTAMIMSRLETKFRRQDTRLLVEAQLRLGLRVPPLSVLEFQGLGRIQEGQSQQHLLTWPAETPAECTFYFGRLSKGSTSYFLFRPRKDYELVGECLIDLRIQTRDQLESGKLGLVLAHQDFQGELFKLNQNSDFLLEGPVNRTRRSFEQMPNHVHLAAPDGSNVPFEVLEASWAEHRNAPKQASTREQITDFQGLKLELEDKENNQNGVTWQVGHQVESQAQCEFACAGNAQCNSFSFCQFETASGREFECLLSRVALESSDGSNVDQQLAPGVISMMQDGSRISLNLDGAPKGFALIRRRQCSVHRKLVSDMFGDQGRVQLPIGPSMEIIQIRDREACARECVRLSLAKLTELDRMNGQISARLNETAHFNLTEINELRYEAIAMSSKICHRFYYMDEAISMEATRAIREYLKLGPTEPMGYCVANIEPSDSHNASHMTPLPFDQFLFKLESLYDRRDDIVMRDKLGSWDTEIFANVSKGIALNGDRELERLRELLNQKQNYQRVIKADASYCAFKCFSQAALLWPWCSSFDVYRKESTKEQYCKLNIVGLESPDALERSKTSIGSKETYHHYEALFKFASLKPGKPASKPEQPTRISAWYSLLIVLCSLLTGLLIAYNVTPSIAYLLNLRSSRPLVVQNLEDIDTSHLRIPSLDSPSTGPDPK